jgi:methyl-accepting chemotaxis protein
MLSNLKLQNRMLLGYSAPVVVCLVLVGLVYSTANKVFDTFEEVARVQNVLIDTSDMSLSSEGMIRSLRGYILDKNQGFSEDYRENFNAAKESAKSVEGLIKLPEQKERLTKMVEEIENYDDYASKVIALIDSGKEADAVALFKSGKGTEFVKAYDRLEKEFKATEESVLKQETQEAKNALHLLVALLLIGSLILIVIAITVALVISSGITRTINQAVNAIASSSTEIAATIDQQERTATHQASAVNQTTTTMDELGNSSRQSAEQAEVAVASAQQVLTLSETGTQTVTYSLQDMAELKEQVEAIAQQIFQLSEQTSQIGNISALVSNLATQTNMLALNAAIEAVRAGENGKGFAVVAAEIRKLAEQSQKSTEKINVLVNNIQAAINSTIIVTNQGRKKVEQGVQTAEGTAATFSRVADAVKNVVTSSQQISLTAKQQAIAIQQVVDAMNSINQGAIQNASGISQTKTGTKKLKDAALHLQSVV